jgi:FkbM family methyltransferase|tara:strand:+ start:2786 stop:3499 length:714 start_codon:yes stop_codon:yes gene_type:complete
MNPVEKEIVKYLDNKNHIVFDVGCFRGTFTKKLIKCGYKLGMKFNFFLFDPNPNVKNYLRRLLKNEKIKYHELALDNSNLHKKFYLNNFFESSGSSLIKLVKDDKVWKRTRKIVMQILQPYKKIGDFSEIIVQTQTLDNFCFKEKIESIDVLKIDAESNELNVLKGAKKLLSENKIYLIYTEIAGTKKKFSEKEKSVFDFLNSNNFELKKKYQIKSASFLSDLKVTDNIFVNKTFIT